MQINRVVIKIISSRIPITRRVYTIMFWLLLKLYMLHTCCLQLARCTAAETGSSTTYMVFCEYIAVGDHITAVIARRAISRKLWRSVYMAAMLMNQIAANSSGKSTIHLDRELARYVYAVGHMNNYLLY